MYKQVRGDEAGSILHPPRKATDLLHERSGVSLLLTPRIFRFRESSLNLTPHILYGLPLGAAENYLIKLQNSPAQDHFKVVVNSCQVKASRFLNSESPRLAES